MTKAHNVGDGEEAVFGGCSRVREVGETGQPPRLLVEHWYPGVSTNTVEIEIDLVHVRASDGIRVRYDFERDGWVILQPTSLDEWREAAFVRSWAMEGA